MEFDLKQSWIEVLEDNPRLQWEVLSVSYSLALLSELLPGTDVSLGFEPLPSVKLSFQLIAGSVKHSQNWHNWV